MENFTIPLVFLVLFSPFIFWEYRRVKNAERTYPVKEVWASVRMYLGRLLSNSIYKPITFAAALGVYQFRIHEFSMNHWTHFVMLFLGVELSYYWYHRLNHEVRFMWAAHNTHHSPNDMVAPVAMRLSWFDFFSFAWLCYMPLALVGFHPGYIFGTLALVLALQFPIHTKEIPLLPRWIELCFNTPANHRVHHGSNEIYLDKNHGGILMLWDHVFGTYKMEDPAHPVRFGLVKPIYSNKAVEIETHEWKMLWKDIKGSRSIRDTLGYIFGPPGWQPEAVKGNQRELHQI